MSADQTGGPAFPASHQAKEGMTLRDWFAGKALHAHLSLRETHDVLKSGTITPADMAGAAYEWADAMIQARETQPAKP